MVAMSTTDEYDDDGGLGTPRPGDAHYRSRPNQEPTEGLDGGPAERWLPKRSGKPIDYR